MARTTYSIGLDFGTESCRALLVDVATGEEAASAVHWYEDGVIDECLPTSRERLPPDWALQNPRDYIESLRRTIPQLLSDAGVASEQVIGVGADFTACTLLATDASGEPLCLKPEWAGNAHAWPKLWKHHAARPQAERISEIARQRGEPFLARYGGRISPEWLFPKALQILDEAPEVFQAAERLIEASDWIVWQLAGVETRNSCTAGYKALWERSSGFPSDDFFRALDARFEHVVDEKLSRRILPIGSRAGEITPAISRLTGLNAGTAVAVGTADAHAALPAATVTRPGAMLMIMGTSICHILLGTGQLIVPGMCGVAADGALSGVFAYEAGQFAAGDMFAWFAKTCTSYASAEQAHAQLGPQAARLRPGESGLLALDWLNGNCSVLADTDLSGLILGLRLGTKQEEIYRALLEAIAFGAHTIIENFEKSGVSVDEVYACGGLPERNELLMQILTDVTGRRIRIARSAQTSALGSAILGALAAGSERGGYDDIGDAVKAMAGLKSKVYQPNQEHHQLYQEILGEYSLLHDYFGRGENGVMKRLKALSKRYRAASAG